MSEQYTGGTGFRCDDYAGFEGFLCELQDSMAADILCIVAQLFLSLAIVLNIRANYHSFPIKQLSPLCTLSALFCFILTNLISFIGRIIQRQKGLYDQDYSGQYLPGKNELQCGQCRINQHTYMQLLALLYSFLREYPLTVFAFKTLRVCVCFLKPAESTLPRWVQWVFSGQKRIIGLSLCYVLLLSIFNIVEFYTSQGGYDSHAANINFQYLCPNRSGYSDWVANFLRVILLVSSYFLSLKTYKELDFKRFIVMIFILSNVQILLRFVLTWGENATQTYHQFYYHSLLHNLGLTMILYPYSQFNSNVQPPPGEAVLEHFDAFLSYNPGKFILSSFADHLDQMYHTQKHTECFAAFLQLREIKMAVAVQPQLIKDKQQEIIDIIQLNEVKKELQATEEMQMKIDNRQIQPIDLKRAQKRLSIWCERHIFQSWKKTKSKDFIKFEFQKNMTIDEKMNLLNIEIGS